jgi:hypothetical protein
LRACAPEALGEKGYSMRARFILSFAQKYWASTTLIIDSRGRSLARVLRES